MALSEKSKITNRKRRMAVRMLRAGKGRSEIQAALKEKYGTALGAQQYQALNAESKQDEHDVVTANENDEDMPEVKDLMRQLVPAMREEGIVELRIKLVENKVEVAVVRSRHDYFTVGGDE